MLTYVDQVSRARLFFSKHGLDLLIVIAAVESAISTALRDDPGHPTGPMLWFEVFAVAAVVLTLLWRRRFPFAAPAVTWLLSAALSFVDGLLIVDKADSSSPEWVLPCCSATCAATRRHGSAWRSCSAAPRSSSTTTRITPKRPVFTPVLFAIGWLVGFALRERTEQTEAAEERAARAEKEAEAAARVAVAEARTDRARAPRRRRARRQRDGPPGGACAPPDARDGHGGSETLENVEQAGRTALAEMRRLLNAMRRDGDELELLPRPGLDNLDSLVADVRAAGLPVRLRSAVSRSRCRQASTSPPTASCRRGSPTPSSTPVRARPRWTCTTPPRASTRGP